MGWIFLESSALTEAHDGCGREWFQEMSEANQIIVHAPRGLPLNSDAPSLDLDA
jgi:hypothetical protein